VRGWPLGRCLQLAVACGSLSTRASGGTAAQPSLEEALDAIEAIA
jgi:sugar/nucleoside kinase (ribokinase family)